VSGITLLQATETCALVVGIGGAGTVLYKGGKALRRLGHFLDKLTGNTDSSEPGIFKRMDALQTVVDDLAHGQVILTEGQQTLTEGAVERNRQIGALTSAVNAMGDKIDNHVDTDATQWKAEGEQWGHKIDGRLDALEAKTDHLP
jgi:hypothetical protein